MKITKEQKFSLWTQTKNHKDQIFCCYCEKEVYLGAKETAHNKATVEHILPIRLGGTNQKSNLAWACFPCNQEKARDLDNLFQRIIEENINKIRNLYVETFKRY